jgi:flagellar hook-associated protein 2
MGMRINTGSGIDPTMVEKLIEVERQPIRAVEQRKNKKLEEQKSFRELSGLVGALGASLNAMRNPTDFVKLKVESSHPDIVDGTVDTSAVPGAYEIEVRSTARTHKLLTDSYPDKDETPVGFGYMTIELDDGSTFDIDIDPGASTLTDVARQINGAGAGCKAVIVNTKENLENPDEENFRLLVISEKSGKQAKVYIDPDTTYLDFKEQVTGRNLEMMFEDVPVFDEDNTVEALLQGVVLNVKRAEPGTKVTVKIDYDPDKALEEIKKFVESYNKLNEFIDKQFQVDPETNKAGLLSGDNTLRAMRRSLQATLQNQVNGKYRNLADVGITSDGKTGALKLDETKVKQALSEDYMGVAKMFTQSELGPGVATRLSDSIRSMQTNQGGFIASKDREYKRVMQGFDDDIARKERLASQRAEGLKRKFAALDSLVSGMNAQGQALQQRLASGG